MLALILIESGSSKLRKKYFAEIQQKEQKKINQYFCSLRFGQNLDQCLEIGDSLKVNQKVSWYRPPEGYSYLLIAQSAKRPETWCNSADVGLIPGGGISWWEKLQHNNAIEGKTQK